MMADDAHLKLALGELHLWLLDAQEVEALALSGGSCLPTEERLRADIFPRPLQRQRYIGRRSALRHILSRYVGLPPQSLPLIRKASGKPLLSGDLNAPHFSLSASEGWVLLAVCDDQAVGVDLERQQEGLDHQGIAENFFDPLERMVLAAARPEERLLLFYRAWTRAEAWLKMTGRGLSGLESLAQRRPAHLWLRDLRLPSGFSGALCLATAPTSVRWMSCPGMPGPSPTCEDLGFALAPLHLLEA